MKKLLLPFLFLFVLSSVFAQERILNYETTLAIETDGDLLVTELITVKAENNKIKRGIYRSFPTKYKNNSGTRFNVGFDVKGVFKNDEKEPYFVKEEKNGETIYIGDKNKVLEPGIYTYKIMYTTSRQIGFFENYDELYFNAIGGDWDFVIEQASVNVVLPNDADVIKKVAFSGFQKATDCNCTIEETASGIVVKTTQPLQPREQLTIAVSWPKGFVEEPTQAEKTRLFISQNAYILFALLTIIIPFILYYRAWKKVGVDPPKGTIIPIFNPPLGFSPATVSYLSRMRFTTKAFTAAIVNLAVKKALTIHLNDAKEYTLKKTEQPPHLLSKEESVLLQHLFKDKTQIKFENKNHKTFLSAQKAMVKSLKSKTQPTYFNTNYRYLRAGFFASLALGGVTFVLSASIVVSFITEILLLIMGLVFLYLIKAPTKKGRTIMDEIEGFKLYLSVAEQKQLDALHPPKMTIEQFETYLPYAIALGVENKWSEKFENEIAKSMEENQKDYSPSWFVAGSSAYLFSASNFSSSIGSGLSSAISSASTPPGSSSGTSGGGFSGGGGGGGGGGGW